MERRKAKDSDLDFSVLGTGCWSFGGGEYWGEQRQKDVNEMVHASVDLGINYFDTAEVYNDGRSESSLGEAIQGIPRDKILIGTKISPSNCYPYTLIKHCHASLKRLRTDYVDIYMLHWPTHAHSLRHFTRDPKIIENPPVIGEVLETLKALQQAGKIRRIGLSNFGTRLMEDLPDLSSVVVNQLPYNLFCRAGEYDALPFCEQSGIAVISYMSLLQGLLGDIYPSIQDIPALQRRTRHFNAKNSAESRHGEHGVEDEINEALEGIRKICKETGLSMPALAIKWILLNPAITCSLVGSRNVRHLELNVRSAEGILSQQIKEELDRITLSIKDKLGNHLDYYENPVNDRTLGGQRIL
ncbi:MAG: aldo/keto reductase [Bacteroidota bacterium]|nr:aldo/keto reductase [Bacteroidota bacterium]MDP4250999.1 aldo/keto reductase [Bacteroidota bacterium]